MVGDVLRDIMSRRKLNVQQLADLAGIPLETLRNIYYNRTTDPKLSTLRALSDSLGVSINYLTGNPIYNADEFELIEHYRGASDRGRSIVNMIAKIEHELSDRERNDGNKHYITCMVPIGKCVDGINWNSAQTSIVETTIQNAFMAVEITTNNFAPAYVKGDRILLENRYPISGEHAVFMKGGKAFFRRYDEEGKEYTLKCINGRCPDIHVKRMDEFVCIGVCIGVIRA